MSDAAKAFISFLRCEAKQAEERAKSLRATASRIEANSLEAQRKNWGRRKRSREPDSQESETRVSGFSLFLQENHESGKKNENSDHAESLENKWDNLCDEEKQAWETRAEELASDQYAKRNNCNRSIERDKDAKNT